MNIFTIAKRIEAAVGGDWDGDDYRYAEKIIQQAISEVMADKAAQIDTEIRPSFEALSDDIKEIVAEKDAEIERMKKRNEDLAYDLVLAQGNLDCALNTIRSQQAEIERLRKLCGEAAFRGHFQHEDEWIEDELRKAAAHAGGEG